MRQTPNTVIAYFLCRVYREKAGNWVLFSHESVAAAEGARDPEKKRDKHRDRKGAVYYFDRQAELPHCQQNKKGLGHIRFLKCETY